MLLTTSPNFAIHRYKVGQLKTNSYLVVHPPTQTALFIDPGAEGDFLSQEILDQQVTLTDIVLTHAHFDHLGGLLALKLNFPTAQIWLNPADQKIYRSASKSAEYWDIVEVDPAPPTDRDLSPDQPFVFGQKNWSVISTPGHTPGGICLYQTDDHLLFSGDTLFAGTIGRTDFSYASPEKMLASLRQLAQLPAETQVFPGHGQMTTIGEEREMLSKLN